VTNEAIAATNQVVPQFVPWHLSTNGGGLAPDAVAYHYWLIDAGSANFGLTEWHRGYTDIYIFRDVAYVPFSAPTVAAGFVLIVLLFLLVAYYLIANLRHKDAPADAKLD